MTGMAPFYETFLMTTVGEMIEGTVFFAYSGSVINEMGYDFYVDMKMHRHDFAFSVSGQQLTVAQLNLPKLLVVLFSNICNYFL